MVSFETAEKVLKTRDVKFCTLALFDELLESKNAEWCIVTLFKPIHECTYT